MGLGAVTSVGQTDECFLPGLLWPGPEGQQTIFRDTCGTQAAGVALIMGETPGSCSPPGVWPSSWSPSNRPSSASPVSWQK